MYQIDGREVLFQWLSRQTDSDRRLLMLEWLAGFAREPLSYGHRVPGVDAPVYIAVAPISPPVVVTFLLAEQFHAVRLIKIQPLR